MAEWSNEKILFFLECYQGEPTIWDPCNKQHKDKKKVADAWERLGVILNTPSKELKAKKEVLMGTFRRHLKKKQDSIRSGAGAEEIYEPIWFAYPLMESFLLPVYTPKTTIDTEMEQSQVAHESYGDENNESEGIETSIHMDETQWTSTTSAKKSRRRPAPEQQMATAFSQLTNALSDRQPTPPIDDECDLYGKLLASKLRGFSKDERQLIMYDIDGIFIQRIFNNASRLETRLPQSPSPYSRLPPASPYSRPPSSSPSNSRSSSEFNFDTPKRPSTAQSSYSEPSTSRLNEPVPKKYILDQPPFAKSPKTSIPMSVQIEIDPFMQSPGTNAFETPLSVALSQQPVKTQHPSVKILSNKKIKILPQTTRYSTNKIQRLSESLQSMDTNSLQLEPGATQQPSQSPSEPQSPTDYQN